MNNILDDYSQEEIEALALKQLESDSDKKIEETSMSIVKIDKEYKKHNSNAVKKAVFNGSVILLCAGIFLNADPNILEFGSEDLTFLYENVINTISGLPKSDILIAVYSKMFEGINNIVDEIGIVGLVLVIKSFKFVVSTVSDGKKALKMKKELSDLTKILEEEKQKKFGSAGGR